MILKDIWMDVKAVQERDPAARNALEVLLLYQGVHALIWHRVAHWFYEHHMFFIARLISQVARFFTLIEIHPGAQLGHGILIDHGCRHSGASGQEGRRGAAEEAEDDHRRGRSAYFRADRRAPERASGT